MTTANVEIIGLDNLNRAFASLAKRFDGRELSEVCLEGARVIQREAKRLAPRGPTGSYRKAIEAFRGRKASKHGAAAISWVRYRIAPHAYWVERGTKERAPKGRAMRIPLSKVGARGFSKRARLGGIFGYVFARRVPPMPAQHVFERAARAKQSEAVRVVATGMKGLALKRA